MVTFETKNEELLQLVIDRFWETIPPVWNQVRGNVRGIATERFDVSVEQFHILRHIRKGINSVSDLADMRQISRPAMSQAVDVLFGKGLITRHQSEEDRRFVQLDLTENGTELLNAIFEQNREWMKQRLASLSAEEIQSIVQSLELLKKTFDEPAS